LITDNYIYLNTALNTCVKVCPTHYVGDIVDHRCKICHATCNECEITVDPNKCLSCYEPFVLMPVVGGNKCQNTCDPPYYKNPLNSKCEL
jgi:hypothetical protein